MRKNISSQGVTVHAVSGSHVVLLGFDLSPARRRGCLGFAIRRTDHTEQETYWMSGTKTFADTDPHLGPGGQVSSRAHPFQTFQWADYSAKPGHDYTYCVVPLYGTPAALTEGPELACRIQTQREDGLRHAVYFNRGAIASQEYARRFKNEPPDQVGEAARVWLSRGLLEGFLAFVHRAAGSSFAIRGACYEFQWPQALEALRDVAAHGADVEVIYDAIPSPTGPRDKNVEAVTSAAIADLCAQRTHGKIMHNKFFVLIERGKPIAVWTGSTNLTENGLFGHLNCGQVIEDPQIAEAYLRYWTELRKDPSTADEKLWTAANNTEPTGDPSPGITAIFSPHSGQHVLSWLSEVANLGERPLFMTFAFGMHKAFQAVYEQPDGVLRFALMEKEGNGAGLAQGKKDIDRIRRLPNVVVAIGHRIDTNSFDHWLKEIDRVTPEVNVRWVHTKFMLVDPLGDDPIVVLGSANFSKASVDTNDENMVVVRGDRDLADAYVVEFMRSYTHHAFREAVAIAQARGEVWTPQVLAPTDAWQAPYFRDGDQRCLRRRYFVGAAAAIARVPAPGRASRRPSPRAHT
jgi:phosphatidylserine/phosphatidylglycerophosphate/cardiolipin synthase-like enzyme